MCASSLISTFERNDDDERSVQGAMRRRMMFGRRRSGVRRAAAVVATTAVVGAAIGLGVWMVLPLLRETPAKPAKPGQPSPGRSEAPRCATASLPGARSLGTLGFIRDGALNVLDLSTCRGRTLVDAAVTGPVRWSPDGRWVAFGKGSVVSADGGAVVLALGGAVDFWQWSPTDDRLAGVTTGGGVIVGGPEEPPRELLPDGAGVTRVAWSPGGRTLAVDRHGRVIQVLDVSTGNGTIVYRDFGRRVAPPLIAGWSPDGRWVLFWPDPFGSASLAADGLSLRAVPVSGGEWVEVTDAMLTYDDFVSACGNRLALAWGSDRFVTVGKQILLTGPPDWRFRNLSHDYNRSWFWPACSPEGEWIAATASANHEETPFGSTARSIWLLSSDGSRRVRFTEPSYAAFELPRWSSDGRVLIYVRRGLEWQAPGRVFLAQLDPRTGRTVRVVGPLVSLGPGGGYYGHSNWAYQSDWYRPE